jgi:hypothetical protein
MRHLRLLFISILVLFLVWLGISLLIPSHIRISRAIDIFSTRQRVYEQISDLRRWDGWNQFTANSGLSNMRFSGPSSGSGAWLQSDQLKIRINNSNTDSVSSFWEQKHGKSFSGGFNIMELRTGTITVQWYFDFYLKWEPWEKFSSIVYDKQLGPVMEESLIKLKTLTESNP